LNLVTGATGILGSHVVLKLLQSNKPVIACKQKDSDLKKAEKLFSYYKKRGEDLFNKIEWRDVDVRDVFSVEEAFEGIDTVYHCAGFVSFNKRDRKKLFKINESGTSNIIAACFQKKIQAFCHVSSIATINNLDYKEPLHENVFWKTSGKECDYALSKYNAEREVWRAMEEGLNALIVNPGVILSPGFWEQSSSKLFNVCYKGNKFYTNGMAGYISARDAAAIMIELTEKKHFANRYILVEDNYTFREILDLISGGFGKQKSSIKAGKSMLQTGRFFDFIASKISGNEQILTSAIVNAALNEQSYLNQKLKRAIDYKFIPVHEEIREICRFFEQDRSV
jgi:dihydroflavonol-4-reductase